ncbi:OstA-like protein [Blattabacterium cuenoti]|uniref:OstA-like protein n=1 Tax=Blattabacterium cuenoti TaxID=1653831 RepID=UPI00163C4C76|nr:OstA-like protein [Blattabacterium cuenoti]
MKYCFLFFFLLLNQAYSENVQIFHADLIQKNDHNNSISLIGNVHFKYKKYHLFCDEAIYHKKNNRLYGHGNVQLESEKNKIISKKIYIEDNFSHFKLSGGVVLSVGKIKLIADTINYDLRKKLLKAVNNVVVFFKKLKLTTNMLEYDFNRKKIFYKMNSIIYYDDYVVHSKEGFFSPDEEKAELKNGIKLISKNYTVYADILEYFFKKNKINFNDSALITQNDNSDNFIYVKKALFFIQKKIFLLEKYISIHYNEKIIKGKYLFFDEKKKYGFIRNFLLEDLKKKYFLMGGYGKFDFNNNSLILKKNPKIVRISKKNSFLIYSDILKMNFKKNSSYLIQAFSVESFFLNESIQGKSSVLNYESSNDYIQFDGNPIFWFQNQQITGKSIYISFQEKDEYFLKTIKIIKNAFYIEKINSKEFNQVEGDLMIGFFNEKNILEKISIQGNINSIIFLSSKENKLMNKSSCGMLSLYLDIEKKIRNISCAEQAYSELIPISEKTPNEFLFLSKFYWKEKEKPNAYKNFLVDKEIEKYRKENHLEQEEIEKIKQNKTKFL